MVEKKKCIITTALDLFSKFGIRSVTMDDLSGELGFSKKTLYCFFKDKKELVAEVMRFNIADLMSHFSVYDCDERNAVDQFLFHRKLLLEKLNRYNPSIAYDLKKYFPAIFNEIREFRRERLYEAHTANLNRGIEEGLYRPELNVDLLSRLMTTHHVFTFDPQNGVFTDEELRTEALMMQFITYHFHAICTPIGLEVFYKLRAAGKY